MDMKEFCSKILCKLLGRRLMYRLRYYHQRHRWPNLEKPQDLSEILISHILSDDFLKYSIYADKIKVRDYIVQKGLGHILLKHYGYWDSANDIKTDELPEKFVLKTNNGSGGKEIIICRDKSKFNYTAAKKKLNKALKKKSEYELHYNKIKPCILCEELIDTGNETWPDDYKFTCIHGKPVDIFVATERGKNVKYCTRNIDWTNLDHTKKEYLPNKIPHKPKRLKEMIEIAKILSADFDFVRVDLYEYKGRVYFSELTFSPWGGLLYSYTDKAIDDYGHMLLCPKK